jgi:DNA-binding beta-propeller fold protein YncE
MFGHVTGVGVDSHNRVFVFHRAEHATLGAKFDSPVKSPAIMVFDGDTGRQVAAWGENLFWFPHGLRVDAHDNIWITDVQLDQVMKFSNDGKLLLTVGEKGVKGNDGLHFFGPADVAVDADGSFYVADGYGNSRVAKFSPEGKFLFDWGRKGDGPGEFDLVHNVLIGSDGRIYVADRSNSRIQIFQRDGTFIAQWKSPELGRPWALAEGPDRLLYVVDGGDLHPWPPDRSHLLKLDFHGNILGTWASYGNYDGQLFWGHDIAVGKDGAVYVGDIKGMHLQKFVPGE